jgi:hypothetical protein
MQENSQKKSKIKQRMLQVIELDGISRNHFYTKTGITRGILDQNNGISEENIAKFLAFFSSISVDWLIIGKGEMLRNDEKNSSDNHSIKEDKNISDIGNGSHINIMGERSHGNMVINGETDKLLLAIKEKDERIDRIISNSYKRNQLKDIQISEMIEQNKLLINQIVKLIDMISKTENKEKE